MTVDEVLKKLEDGGSDPAEDFQNELSKTAEDNDGSTSDKSEEDIDREKIAELDQSGRIMARGFYDELEKLAKLPMGAGGTPPDTGSIPDNPNVEVPKGEMAADQNLTSAQVRQLLKYLTQATQMGAGELATSGKAQPAAKTNPQSAPVAADVQKAQAEQATQAKEGEFKKEANQILENLHNRMHNQED